MDYSLLGSSIHGIYQVRILEWVAISFSRGSSWPRDRTQHLHCRQMLYHLNHQGSPFRQYWLSTTTGNADCLYYNHSSFLLMESPLYLALESINIKREWSLPDLMGWTLIRLSQSCYVDFNLFAVIMLRLDRWHNSD